METGLGLAAGALAIFGLTTLVIGIVVWVVTPRGHLRRRTATRAAALGAAAFILAAIIAPTPRENGQHPSQHERGADEAMIGNDQDTARRSRNGRAMVRLLGTLVDAKRSGFTRCVRDSWEMTCTGDRLAIDGFAVREPHVRLISELVAEPGETIRRPFCYSGITASITELDRIALFQHLQAKGWKPRSWRTYSYLTNPSGTAELSWDARKQDADHIEINRPADYSLSC